MSRRSRGTATPRSLDLTLNTFESGTAWSAIRTYATDLFLPATIERLSQHSLNLFQANRRSAGAAPFRRSWRCFEDSERERIERQWNANGLDFDRSQCIHRLNRSPGTPHAAGVGRDLGRSSDWTTPPSMPAPTAWLATW
ncbi:hypothetical protein [Pseudomonas sp. BNK-44-a]|uniref:hypothetical protein n=1 Tax=Pseudomonas sp. BNK-44-a TaxID=3376178 RepID=UPI0039BF9E75